MLSLIRRIKLFLFPDALMFSKVFCCGLTTFVQGYLENDPLKIRLGAVILTTVRSIDNDALYEDEFLEAIDDVFNVYGLKQEQVDELLSMIQDHSGRVGLELSAVNILLNEHIKKKREKPDENKRKI